MPRIDPVQLLNCLSVLMSPHGGIKSRDEVHRLAGLMTKYSKKLVSKCIYIQILKCTETDLLGLFMGSGGWRLVHMWLTESIVAQNWPLIRELLELLLLCPVDIERLKTNNCPKLVKELSKDGNHFVIRALASKLVEQWLKTVKGEQVVTLQISDIPQIISEAQVELKSEVINTDTLDNEVEKKSVDLDNSVILENGIKEEKTEIEPINSGDLKIEPVEKEEVNTETDTLPVLKITLKNGKQVVSQVEDDDNKVQEGTPEKDKSKEKHRSKSKDKSHDKNRSSSSSRSSSSKHSSKSPSDKHKSSSKDSSSKHSSKDKSRDKDRHSSHSSKSKSSSSSSSSSKKSSSSSSSNSKSKDEKSEKVVSDKDKVKEKDAEKERKPSIDKTGEKITSPSIHKLGKIPKLSDVKKEKPSISIEVRKPDEPKPKTVKTFHSKFRNHGLAEEIKPPPSRAALLNKKPPPPALPPTVSIPKRPSPVHNEPPPEKKPKTIEMTEKPGAIKLIPPKPKPMVLQESDMFMDALNKSATNKKEPKKRKRRISGSKDASNDGSPPHTPTSPSSESKSVPPRFYQDTLDEEDNKDKSPDNKDKKSTDTKESEEIEVSEEKKVDENMDTSESHTLTVNGLKGVLCYHKRKGPKKSIRWKPDAELEEIQYFELDETERVNVTKTFTDMKHLERIHEREAFQKARNLINDDVMEERTTWRPLIPVDAEDQVHIEYGKNSKEKDIQAIRQKGTLQPLYFHKAMIPDSPHEPDPETHTYSEPIVIPLEDATGNQDNISDFRNMPWPEPKGNAPPANSSSMNVPTMFPAGMSQFPNTFPPAQFPGVPGFPPGQPMMPGDWPNGVPTIIPNGMPGPMPAPGMAPGPMGPGPMVPGQMVPGPIPPGNMPPGMMVPPENMMMGPDMFVGPNMFPVPPDGFNMPQNMFPPVDFNMSGPPGPDGPGFAGPGNFRGAMRGRGAGGWRGKQSGSWEGPPRGRGGRGGSGRKTVCIYFQRKGSCRQGDNCTFLHPGVNCPY